MRILCITDVFYPRKGGTEIILYEIFKRLVKKGFEINVVTPKMKGTEKIEEKDGMKIFRTPPSNRFFFMFSALRKSFELVKKSDIIQTTVWFGGFPSALTKIISKKPAVLMVNGFFGWRWIKFENFLVALLNYLMERILFSLPFDRFCCLSNSQAQLVSKIMSKEKIRVTYPGVNFNIFKPRKYSKKSFRFDDGFIYCYYGRYDSQKGVDTLLKAAKIFSKKCPDSKLLIITPQYKEVSLLIKKFGLNDHVILYSGKSQKELGKILNVVDVIVVPSKELESFGMTAAEASALEKPVISSYMGGLKEIVKDEKTGFLIDPNNPQQIAEKLEILYNNPKLRKRMGKEGRKYVKKFSWDRMANQYAKIYEELVNK